MKMKAYIITILIIVLPGILFLSCAGSNIRKTETPLSSPQGTTPAGGGQPAKNGETEDIGGDGKESVPAPQPEPDKRPEAGGVRSADVKTEKEKSEIPTDTWVLGEETSPKEPAESSPRKTALASTESSTAASKVSASGLKAGYADDNRQYGYFVKFLKDNESVDHLPLPVNERIILKVEDKDGKSIPNADVEIFGSQNRMLCSGKTLADGSFFFFPSEYDADIEAYQVRIQAAQQSKGLTVPRNGKRELPVEFPFSRSIEKAVPLDIVFVMDTTGSMGEEIERLKTTIQLIHLNLTALTAKPKIRFGMVLYKDIHDEYITLIIPLTEDLKHFQASLDRVEASGGGDTPEDLQSALKDTIQTIKWNTTGIRLAFIITDAPPHLDYGQAYTYVKAVQEARERGIKIFSVGTGGLDLMGEYILRQIAQYTAGKYIFLTYGETGESEGGRPGSVSHHTGANFQTDKLEAIIIRFAKEELSYLTDQPLEEPAPYFTADKVDDEQKEETLKKLFSLALSQLADYSTYSIKKDTTAAILPVLFAGSPAEQAHLAAQAEYFTERLVQAALGGSVFRLVERQDLQKIMDELKLQLSGLTDDSKTSEIGKMLNAELLISGRLYKKENLYELFLKLLRVETGELLSVTQAKIDPKLGL
ncbi:MAG: VWA domain-containing protein [Spirochaetota bacterium]